MSEQDTITVEVRQDRSIWVTPPGEEAYEAASIVRDAVRFHVLGEAAWLAGNFESSDAWTAHVTEQCRARWNAPCLVTWK